MGSSARRIPLVLRLFAVITLAGLGLGLLLLLWLEPRTMRALQDHGRTLLAEGAEAMHELAHEHSAHHADLLIDLVRGAANDRESALADLGLDQFGGDTPSIRAAIRADDARRSAHHNQEVVQRTDAVQRRIEASIDARLRALAASQKTRTDEFVRARRVTDLLLVATTLALLLLVLGVFVHRLVVLPVRRLALATQAVSDGDLTATVPRAGRDEIGDLARAFADMLAQLRTARATQQQRNASLADEVAAQTQHLQQALTELRTSHRQLAAAERLASLGTLAGGIAHEFHNVIGGIRGCAEDLATDEVDPNRKETLAVITRAADRASAIVHQLQRFARRTVDTSSDFDLAAVVEDALRLCEPAARRQSVQVVRALLPAPVHGSADGLHQVCVNLFVNALQAMPDGGTLRVTVQRERDSVEVRVDDTGVGIKAAHLPHVFEPFFTTRGDASDPQRRGSGLGLSVSWGIVTAHGGRIEVRSVPGTGTTFTVRLPDRPHPVPPG